MLILIIFAFFGGLITILSPCILPILPIILAGSVGSGRRKPFGIVSGFILSFTFFTLFLTAIVQATGISADSLRYISIFILIIFGLTLVLPSIQARFEQLISKFSLKPKSQGEHHGFGGGMIIGFSLGLLWTPCVGPILASVISLALTGTVTGSAFIITFAYSLGTALPMLSIIYGGRQLLNKVPWLLQQGALIQKIFGLIMIIMALLIYFNIDRQFQSYILEKFPNYGSQLTGLEDNDMIKKELNNLSQLDSLNKADNLAPELVVGGQWLNSQALSLAELKGKVVLLDFMTYSCINCIRTFPYLQAWHESYQDNGLVVIGLHSPEFEFEKNPENVKKALTEFGITFPVMQDNDFATWKNYNNKYWPHTFLIDYNGQIVYDHIGEGNYDVTEAKIKELLEQRQEALGEVNSIEKKLVMPTDQLNTLPQSPETYFGSSRNNLLANGKSLTEGIMDFEMPSDIKTNRLYLVGKWRIYPEYAENIDNDAKIIFSYSAKKVFLVAGADQAVDLKIKQDGQDIADHIKVSDEQLYTLIQNSAPGNHTIEIIPQSAGFRAFTFTFE